MLLNILFAVGINFTLLNVKPFMNVNALQFGFDTFGDLTVGTDGTPESHAQVIRNVVDEAVLADQVGLYSIGIGEHHRDDYAISAPEMVLAGIATRTTNLHLSTAVTVLSSDDPVRIHERFATLDALSNGRAEIIVGRGSFTESFPLFGYQLSDYEELFEEKLDLFTKLRAGGTISWQGRHTQNLDEIVLYPTMEHGSLPTWVAVGGSPNSVIRAAQHQLPLFLAIIGGNAARFTPFTDLYHRALAEFGSPELPVAFHSPGHIAATDEQAREEFLEPYRQNMGRLSVERGWGTQMTREHYLDELANGALLVGSPDTVARKLADGIKALGATRFHLKQSMGSLSHEAIMSSLELYGTKVVPLVRDMLS